MPSIILNLMYQYSLKAHMTIIRSHSEFSRLEFCCPVMQEPPPSRYVGSMDMKCARWIPITKFYLTLKLPA